MLTLSEAQKTGRLQEFAEQEAERGVAKISAKSFDVSVKRVLKPLPPQDQTSGSRGRGGLRGK